MPNVMDLANTKIIQFTDELTPIEALVSAAMIEDCNAHKLVDGETRQQYRNQITYGQLSARIGNLAVLL